MRTPIINVMDRAARRAGRALARDFGEVQQLQASRKGAGGFAGAAMRKASETVRYELAKARPEFGFFGDAPAADAAATPGHRWIVDPLDGRMNYEHGQPHFAISIAHEDSGALVEGIVYEPLRDELFWAVRNSGAYLNDMRLRVSARQKLSACVIATGQASDDEGGQADYLAALSQVMSAVAAVRNLGAPALDLAYVAAGRFDGLWQSGMPPQAAAAGLLIVREAGGFVADSKGRDATLTAADIVAANDQIHADLLRCLRAARRIASPGGD